MNNIPALNIFWFRRDLRIEDNTGLYHALKDGLPVLPLFIFDENILSKLEDQSDARVSFIYNEIVRLKITLEKAGSSLLVKYGKPDEIFRDLADKYSPSKVFTNHDYEPYANERDMKVGQILRERQIIFITCKDQVIFEKNEVVKDSGEPYTVFTPFSKKWKTTFFETGIVNYSSENLMDHFVKISPLPIPGLASIGFAANLAEIPSREPDITIIKDYNLTRDFPATRGTSRLGIHLRFGTISIRQLVKIAASTNEVYLNELIWREFYMMILWHFPHVAERSFKPQYDRIPWRNDEVKFAAWCEGRTGYPIVDAGMRQLNQTGYMHNRVRMITASFLTKHLLTDWRWGEAYFAKKLLDYELASNNGGWQWAAGTGCDAAPYFRVFNPALQTEKFDTQKAYIRKWVPEFVTARYPRPGWG
ncbi:MAG: deoxyribodipyrimidine photo-lyase [Bacteroidales bacterium]|nr:deoxyribodipyrimidine photo-lyase [Bacteroidales bacterium]